jgi:hypothetical protein
MRLQSARRPEHRPLLRQRHELGAILGGGTDEALGHLEVAVVVVGGIELYGCCAHLSSGPEPGL